MADYIDREKLVMTISSTISEVAKEAPYDRVWFSRMAARQAEIINIIYDMPAADVVEVVRCKDCEHYNAGHIQCSRIGLEDNDYCSWAVRKGERRSDD